MKLEFVGICCNHRNKIYSLLNMIIYLPYYSGTSRFVLVLFERYGHPKKYTQKILVTLFPYIFHVKTKWNIVYEYWKIEIFSSSRDTNILPQIRGTSNIFGPAATTIGGLGITKLSNP